MVVIFYASSLMGVNKCAIKLSQCDTEVLSGNSWKSEGMLTLCIGAQHRSPEAPRNLGWEVHRVQSSAGSPAWFLSIITTVLQISVEGRSPAVCLALCQKNASLLLLDAGLPPDVLYLLHIHCPSGDEKMQAEPYCLPDHLT